MVQELYISEIHEVADILHLLYPSSSVHVGAASQQRQRCQATPNHLSQQRVSHTLSGAAG